jgi:hypothetical protein
MLRRAMGPKSCVHAITLILFYFQATHRDPFSLPKDNQNRAARPPAFRRGSKDYKTKTQNAPPTASVLETEMKEQHAFLQLFTHQTFASHGHIRCSPQFPSCHHHHHLDLALQGNEHYFH